MRDENSVGSARASSNELVCSDWVPPRVAAMVKSRRQRDELGVEADLGKDIETLFYIILTRMTYGES